MVASIGFYVAVTWLSRGSLGGGGLRSDLVLEVRLNGLYFRAGTISGPVLGALGGWIAGRRPALIPIVAGALLAGEILAVAVVQGRSLPVGPGMFFWWVSDWTPYIAQAAAGTAVIAVTLLNRRRLSR